MQLLELAPGGKWAADATATLDSQARTVTTAVTGATTLRLAARPPAPARLAFAQGSDTNSDGIANEADRFDVYLTGETAASVQPALP